jgi:tRNA(Ile)-lysidine synthase
MLNQLLLRCHFPAPGTAVACAVSGGADSTALMILARGAALDVTAIHVDHGLRSDSAADASVVAELASRFGASFRAERVQLAPGPNLEARARRARYAVLPEGVMTGHTADDQAETVLLNLLRGAATDGLAGMRDHGRVRRPLLDLRRGETRALCASLSLEVVDDPANLEARFTRNRVRAELIGVLADVGGRDPVPILTRQAGLMADDADLLDTLADQLDPTDARALTDAPLPLARRAIRRWLRAGAGPERHPPSAAEVERVLAVARGDAVACELGGGRRVERRARRLRVIPQ